MAEEITKVIVAEDEPASRALLQRHLENAGFEVIACPDGVVALEAVCREGGGIVVADWMMPELDGIELCRKIREKNASGELDFVFYILLTAHSGTDQIVAGLEAGADDYLTKPYQRDELLARLRAGLRIVKLQRELIERQEELRQANTAFKQLNEKLESASRTDELTQLPNRRAVFDHFAAAWSWSERNDQPLGCIMFDIDRFKRINDTYGHAAGDVVLREVASACRGSMRGYDILGRIGGEEFCIVCSETARSGLATVAERIRTTIESRTIVVDNQTIPVTVSIGAAVRRPAHRSPDDLLAAADELLYQAKENGRNQSWEHDEQGRPQKVARAPAAV